MKIDFEKIKDLKIVCIGDIMLDAFVYGSVTRISPEAPVPVMKTSHTDYMLGGVGNVAVNLLNLGANVTLFAMIGEDDAGKRVAEMLEQYPNLEAYVYVDKTINTTTKTRFVSGHQHLVRIDQEDLTVLTPEIELLAEQALQDVCGNADVIIISDYNKGFVSNRIKQIIGKLQTHAFKIVDTKGDLHSFTNIDMVTPNIKELEKYSQSKISGPQDVSKALDLFYKNYAIANVLVTASEHGMILYEQLGLKPQAYGTAPSQPIWRVHAEPAYNNNPIDVSGAGDTVVAAVAIGVALKVDYQYVLEFASHCAAVVIGKKGTSFVSQEEIKHRYNLIVPNFRDQENLVAKIKQQKKLGRTIGLVNGCFDIIHAGHLELLKQARDVCNYLVVAINADTTVTQLKGPTRPINDEQSRGEMLLSLKYVDEVVIFDETNPTEIIKKIVPDFVFKGKEYEGRQLSEQQALDDLDVSVIFFDTKPTTTTAIIEKIRND